MKKRQNIRKKKLKLIEVLLLTDSSHISTNKYAQLSLSSIYEERSEHFGYSKNSRGIPNSIGNCYGTYSIACSLDFFMEEERKHYRLLNMYVFSALSQIQLEVLNPHYEENDVIPTYDPIPTYTHFDEAILHMKKDKTNLDNCLESITALLNEYNADVKEANSFINNMIDGMIRNAGFHENDANQMVNITEIKRLTKLFLRDRIFKSPDIYRAAHDFSMNPEEKERHASIHDTIINVIREDEIIKKMAPLKGLQNVLSTAFISMRNKAAPISNSITEGSYETRADCCPTYWSLIKRFI